MTGSKRRDKAVWWACGFAMGCAFLLLVFGETFQGTLLFAAIPAIICVLAYGLLGPWYRTTLGRVLFMLMLINAALLSITYVNTYLDYQAEFFLARFSILVAGVTFWTLVAYLIATMSQGWRISSYRSRRALERHRHRNRQ